MRSQLLNSTMRRRGFSLIEVMIVVAILGILAMVALPTFNDSVRKSRRGEAMSALAAVQQAEERWRSNNASYTTSLSDLNLSSATASGYYALTVAAPPAEGSSLTTGYVATAYGQADTSQANDTQCRRLGVLLDGGTLKYAGCGSCTSFSASDFTTSHACWAQ